MLYIVDGTHHLLTSVASFDEIYCVAAYCHYEVMVVDLKVDEKILEKRLDSALKALRCPEESVISAKLSLTSLTSSWEDTPEYFSLLDISWLLVRLFIKPFLFFHCYIYLIFYCV